MYFLDVEGLMEPFDYEDQLDGFVMIFLAILMIDLTLLCSLVLVDSLGVFESLGFVEH